MHKYFYRTLAILVVVLLLVACIPGSAENTLSKKPVIVWIIKFEEHEETEEFFSELMTNKFLVIHPEVTVIGSALTADELLERFKADAQLGLGPDLLMSTSAWIPELAEMGLLQDLNGRDDIDTSIVLPGRWA